MNDASASLGAALPTPGALPASDDGGHRLNPASKSAAPQTIDFAHLVAQAVQAPPKRPGSSSAPKGAKKCKTSAAAEPETTTKPALAQSATQAKAEAGSPVALPLTLSVDTLPPPSAIGFQLLSLHPPLAEGARVPLASSQQQEGKASVSSSSGSQDTEGVRVPSTAQGTNNLSKIIDNAPEPDQSKAEDTNPQIPTNTDPKGANRLALSNELEPVQTPDDASQTTMCPLKMLNTDSLKGEQVLKAAIAASSNILPQVGSFGGNAFATSAPKNAPKAGLSDEGETGELRANSSKKTDHACDETTVLEGKTIEKRHLEVIPTETIGNIGMGSAKTDLAMKKAAESGQIVVPPVTKLPGNEVGAANSILPKKNLETPDALPVQQVSSLVVTPDSAESRNSAALGKGSASNSSNSSESWRPSVMSRTDSGTKGAAPVQTTQTVGTSDARPVERLSSLAVTLDSSGTQDLASANEGAALSSSGLNESAQTKSLAGLEKLESQIQHCAVRVEQAQPHFLAVTIRPDAHTELRLQLSMQNEQVQVKAECQRGDFAALEKDWGQLQKSLSDHGIRLGGLEQGSTFSSEGKWSAQHFEHPEQRYRNPEEEKEPAMTLSSTKPQPARPRALRASQAGAWETWA